MNMQNLWSALVARLFRQQARASASAAHLQEAAVVVVPGPTLTDELLDAVEMVVDHAYQGSLAIQATWCRQNAHAVSCAASLGLITTSTSSGYSRIWRPTTAGMVFLTTGELAC